MMQPNLSIDMLLEAANYLENTNAEHGYAASPIGYSDEGRHRSRKSNRRLQNRSSHNQLEKNRRAHLRQCLDRLKAIVPLNRDSTRHTTLGLLNDASKLIKNMERRNLDYQKQLQVESEKHETLKKRLVQLENARVRRDSTGSSWSSARSESSNDSDKDEEPMNEQVKIIEQVKAIAPPSQPIMVAKQQVVVTSKPIQALQQQQKRSQPMQMMAPTPMVVATASAAAAASGNLATSLSLMNVGGGGNRFVSSSGHTATINSQAKPSKMMTINFSKPLRLHSMMLGKKNAINIASS